MTDQGDRPTSRVLISGASFAGLATAYWMSRLGYQVTVVEIGSGLKKGGTPVDIREGTVEVVKRMGLLDRIRSKSLKPRGMEFKNGDGATVAFMPGPADADAEYEIERDALLDIMFQDVAGTVEFIFGDGIVGLRECDDHVDVSFKSGRRRAFSLVFGCDGIHSAVRRIWFGDEAQYVLFMKNYFAISIVDELLIEEDSSQIYNAPGKTAMLNTYNGKTDIAFCFFSDQEIPYDYRDRDQQRRMIRQAFAGEGWRTRELLDIMDRCPDFYFDKLCQIRMPSWTRGRVAMVGDAGYCASPTAGMGGSLAIVGATALADAFQRHPNDFKAAFHDYDTSFRPVVDEIQAHAIDFGLEVFAPRTQEAICQRNAQFPVA